MSLSNEDSQKYVGQSLESSKQELEDQGYKIHLVRTGMFAKDCVPAGVLHIPKPTPPPEKRVVISYDGDDPHETITSIKQDLH